MAFLATSRFIYRGFKARYRDERAELKALTAALSPTDVAVDVGAHKGSYLWSLSRSVSKGRVIAFEPQPLLADYLLKACHAARLDNVTVEALGVSERSEMSELAIPRGRIYSHGASFEEVVAKREECDFIRVPTVSLDDYFAEEKSKIGIIKIDAEGHELAILRGATRVIDVHRPTILCESEERHADEGNLTAVLHFMAAQNYSAYFFSRSELRPAAEFDPRIHQRRVGERFWDARDYCNNFIFKPRPAGTSC